MDEDLEWSGEECADEDLFGADSLDSLDMDHLVKSLGNLVDCKVGGALHGVDDFAAALLPEGAKLWCGGVGWADEGDEGHWEVNGDWDAVVGDGALE